MCFDSLTPSHPRGRLVHQYSHHASTHPHIDSFHVTDFGKCHTCRVGLCGQSEKSGDRKRHSCRNCFYVEPETEPVTSKTWKHEIYLPVYHEITTISVVGTYDCMTWWVISLLTKNSAVTQLHVPERNSHVRHSMLFIIEPLFWFLLPTSIKIGTCTCWKTFLSLLTSIQTSRI